jgi:hypothetical protein
MEEPKLGVLKIGGPSSSVSENKGIKIVIKPKTKMLTHISCALRKRKIE